MYYYEQLFLNKYILSAIGKKKTDSVNWRNAEYWIMVQADLSLV